MAKDMKLTIDRKNLLHGLKAVGKAIEKGSLWGALMECALLEIADGDLVARGTNLETYLEVRLKPIKAPKAFRVAVPVLRLMAFLSALKAETVALESVDNGGKLAVRSGDASATILCCDATEYPWVDAAVPEDAPLIDAGLLREMAAKTLYACAAEKQRYALNGALLRLEPKTLALQATDGRRLALISRKVEADAVGEAILPQDFFAAVEALGEDVGKAMLHIGDRKVVLKGEGATVISLCVEGRFPPLEDVIPKAQPHSVHMVVDDAVRAIKTAQVMADSDSLAVKITLTPTKATFAAVSAEKGEAHAEIECKCDVDSITIAVNPAYLLEAIATLDSALLNLEFDTPTKPLTLRDSGLVALIMPITKD